MNRFLWGFLGFAVVATICAIGAFGFVVFQNKPGSTADKASATMTTTVTSTASSIAQKPTPQQTTSTTTAPKKDNGRPSNLSDHGWSGYPGASCNSNDTWVFAAEGHGNYMTICRVGQSGGLYYRGYFDGGSWEADVSYSDLGSSTFEVPAYPAVFHISPNGLAVSGPDPLYYEFEASFTA
ncbi:hypothetical protein [Corynebacterium argentoratense]|uniref:hypothetical protein n=1 Tax=Corynebacterium argentoratense TaxID=42817 RepID=UPI0028F14FB1|nr:hypothetical protein [Corynebacterium argentoratense]